MSNTPYTRALMAQNKAAHPLTHAFVSANAGSGKTRVLIDRVARLLLKGAAPDRLICVTYTRAAASEMQARLFQRLGSWSIMKDEDLYQELSQLEDSAEHDITPQALARARRLFARALETPGGIKIQTVHAWCERILRRFPLEAGLSPHFEVLDECNSKDLREKAHKALIHDILHHPDASLAQAHRRLSLLFSRQKLDSLLSWALQRVSNLTTWSTPQVFEGFGLEENMTEEGEAQKILNTLPCKNLEKAAHLLSQTGGKTDQQQAERLQEGLRASKPLEAMNAFFDFVFTQKGEIRKNLITQKGKDQLGTLLPLIEEARDVLETGWRHLQSISLARTSAAALLYTQTFIRLYDQEKQRHQALDFSDLVLKTKDLLMHAETRDWVRYKLDGGLDHILIDEAQDTSPEQWALITALSEEFFTGEGARGLQRTIFAVGDEKQSIYAFQGAQPEGFLNKAQKVSQQAAFLEQRFIAPSLSLSFRSRPEILHAVDGVFSSAPLAEQLTPRGDIPRHDAWRAEGGSVTWWPVAPKPEQQEPEDPWAPVDALPSLSAPARLALELARFIRKILNSGQVEVGGRDGLAPHKLRPGDIMILVRRRNDFFEELIRCLKRENLPVAGADRLKLGEHPVVEDLISFAKASLMPGDDLALAEVLKSPFFNISEEDLYRLAHGRTRPLWRVVQDSRKSVFKEARCLMRKARVRSRFLGPYDFFSWILHHSDQQGESFGARLRYRFGPECEDPLEAFLSMALTWQNTQTPSLSLFLQAFASHGEEIKRDMEEGGSMIRVMTVHAAKGLEAPFVILPDTMQTPEFSSQPPAYEDEKAGMVVVDSSLKPLPESLVEKREQQKQKEYEEYLRLLYVAMTRAEDHLLLCGYETGRRPTYDPWHGLVGEALKRFDTASVCETPFGEGLCLGGGGWLTEAYKSSESSLPLDSNMPEAPQKTSLPVWVREKASPLTGREERLSPSKTGAKPSSSQNFSPLQKKKTGLHPARRGVLIHKLLQFLPDLPSRQWREKGEMFLQAEDIPHREREVWLDSVIKILEEPQWAFLFSQTSRAEVDIAGHVMFEAQRRFVKGRLDRLAFEERTVWIVDYKTALSPPRSPEELSLSLLQQMELYQLVLQQIYPDHTLRCAFLWTHEPRLMVVPDDLFLKSSQQI